MKKEEEQIMTEITNFCENCPSSDCCPELDCVLYRIETIISKEKVKKGDTKDE